ncbi:DUF4382 domain-containing protein [Aeromonas encheleia]|uniref:DUF4382 domain-containing protein n=1 Tax=Aeromonas encheleia TaxID=73010 RepID=A0AAE9MHA8_9GAMM|nr:DUF4382 domain-containing protein [Aeromonas encheleia]USV57571.1 DUF4382 domain-containing protein [Aeromonas encheleia]
MKHLPLLGLTVLLTACGGGDGDNNAQPPSDAKMSLAFSDAPVDHVSKVCIAVSNIMINPVSGTELAWTTASFLTTTQDDGCTPAGMTIPVDSAGHPQFVYIDLLAYPGSSSRPLLASQSVIPGEYSQMRLHVLDGRSVDNQFDDNTPYSYVKQDDGVIKPLEVPSSELKLDAFTIAANGTSFFTTEFDLRHSMVLPGHQQYYKLKPRGVRLVNNTEVATVKGTVAAELCSSDLSDAFVYFYDELRPMGDDAYPDMADLDNGFYASAPVVPLAGGDYGYELGFVNLGHYDVTLVCNGSVDDPELPDDATTTADDLVIDQVQKDRVVVAPTTSINFQ